MKGVKPAVLTSKPIATNSGTLWFKGESPNQILPLAGFSSIFNLERRKMKILLGVLIGIGLCGLLFSVKAGYIQDLATGTKVYNTSNVRVDRFEWYGESCYIVTSEWTNATVGISCVKSNP